MVDDSAFVEGPHLLVVVFVFVEDPFEIGNALTSFYLFPYLALEQDLADEVLIVVAFYD